MKDKRYKIFQIMIIAGTILSCIGFLLLMFVEYMFFVMLAGIILIIIGFLCRKKYYKNCNQTQNTKSIDTDSSGAQATSTSQTEAETELDSMMSAQLIANFKKDHDKKYSDEYLRRLMHIGFSEKEAFLLFTTESLNMKHESVTLLQSPTYIRDFYFDLKHKLLPLDYEYYIQHQIFTVTEVTKIWDEAEWHYHNSHESDMPDEVWHEIFKLTRYGGGELIMGMLKQLSERTEIPFSKITNFSVKEQDMLFKYKWNRQANEPHPYH